MKSFVSPVELYIGNLLSKDNAIKLQKNNGVVILCTTLLLGAACFTAL